MDSAYFGLVDAYSHAEWERMRKRDGESPVVNPETTVLHGSSITVNYPKIIYRPVVSADIKESNAPGWVRMNALFDTGAAISGISKKRAEMMGLHEVDRGIGISATGQIETPYYSMDIRLDDDIIFERVKVIEFPLARHDVDFLVGMDIISRGKFSICGEGGKSVVTFEVPKTIAYD